MIFFTNCTTCKYVPRKSSWGHHNVCKRIGRYIQKQLPKKPQHRVGKGGGGGKIDEEGTGGAPHISIHKLALVLQHSQRASTNSEWRERENIIVSADPQPRDHPAVASRPTPARRPPEKSWATGHLRCCLRERERDRWAGEWEKINPKSGAVPRRSSGAPPRFRADKYVAVDFIFFSSVPPNTHNITAVFLPRDNRQQAGTPSQNIVP